LKKRDETPLGSLPSRWDDNGWIRRGDQSASFVPYLKGSGRLVGAQLIGEFAGLSRACSIVLSARRWNARRK
jgi:hypothetical protein